MQMMNLRPIGRLTTVRLPTQQCRPFSQAVSRWQSQQTDNRTTHFGFETVAESEKEARGESQDLSL